MGTSSSNVDPTRDRVKLGIRPMVATVADRCMLCGRADAADERIGQGIPLTSVRVFAFIKGTSKPSVGCAPNELGWELVLNVNGSLQRSDVCRNRDEILDKVESWKAAMLARGWS